MAAAPRLTWPGAIKNAPLNSRPCEWARNFASIRMMISAFNHADLKPFGQEETRVSNGKVAKGPKNPVAVVLV